MLKNLVVSTVLTVSLFSWQSVFANMSLNMENSSISFVSIKKGSTGEVHTFKRMKGSLSDKGDFNLTVDLSSVDTRIPIRDERMQKTLFETDKFPSLVLTAKVDANVAEGEMKPVSADATLDLHGIKQNIKVDALVSKVGGKLLAVSKSPVIISAATFGMEEGLKKLQEIAKLPSIATAVPVSFILVFE